MTTSKTKKQDTFQFQFKRFKMLILGSKMNIFSSLFLICVSFVLLYFSNQNIGVIISLLLGVSTLAVYITKFLRLKDIDQKSYTQLSLTSSISKFKTYIAKRKKYEGLFMTIYLLSLIPFVASYLDSGIKAIIIATICITTTTILGLLSFKKIDSDLETLEIVMQKEMDSFTEVS